jgi:hypothetical protein
MELLFVSSQSIGAQTMDTLHDLHSKRPLGILLLGGNRVALWLAASACVLYRNRQYKNNSHAFSCIGTAQGCRAGRGGFLISARLSDHGRQDYMTCPCVSTAPDSFSMVLFIIHHIDPVREYLVCVWCLFPHTLHSPPGVYLITRPPFHSHGTPKHQQTHTHTHTQLQHNEIQPR